MQIDKFWVSWKTFFPLDNIYLMHNDHKIKHNEFQMSLSIKKMITSTKRKLLQSPKKEIQL